MQKYAQYIEMHNAPSTDPREVPLLEYASSESQRLNHPEAWHDNHLSAPVRLSIMVTALCNCSCRYCCNKSVIGDRRMIAAENYLRILREAKECGCINIVFTGGEPTLYGELPRLIGCCSDLGLSAELSSRAQPDMALWNTLLANGLRQIQVSLDSVNEIIVDRLCGAGVFRKTAALLTYLLAQDVDLLVNCVMTRPTIDGVAATVDRLLDMGVSLIRLSPFMPLIGKGANDELTPTSGQQDRFNELVAANRGRWGSRVSSFVYSFESRHRLVPDGEAQPGGAKAACASGASEMLIGYQGNALYCDRVISVPAMVYGNIQNSSLLQLWQSEELRRLRQPDRALHNGSVCGECPHFEPCLRKGKCYYYAMLNYSTLYAPDFLCERIRHAGQRQGII